MRINEDAIGQAFAPLEKFTKLKNYRFILLYIRE